MADQYTPLPVKTKTAGDIVANINNGTVTALANGTITAGTLNNLVSGTINAIAAGTITTGTVSVTIGTVTGKDANAAAQTANPVGIGGTDSGGTIRTVLVDSTGAMKVSGASAGTFVNVVTGTQQTLGTVGVLNAGTINAVASGTITAGTVTVGSTVISPQISYQTSSALAAGALATLSFTAITNGKTGYLQKVIASSSVPIRLEVQKVDDAGTGIGTAGVMFTSAASPTTWWESPAKQYFTRASTGTAKFRAVITNEDNALAADVYATGFWDEF